MARPWAVEREVGSAAAFHVRELPEPVHRSISVLEVDRPTLVLGSTQAPSVADGAALSEARVDLVRRRSGGGAVLLVPGETLWVDAVIPRADPLWDDDVGHATHWLGRCWAGALGDLGAGARVHTGALVRTRWSSLVCFAALGPGEVSVGGRKVVGIAQRRTRAGARFQCALHRWWRPASLISLLRLDEGSAALATAELAGVADGLDRPFEDVVDALLSQIGAAGGAAS